MIKEQLYILFKVTQLKAGAVFKTKRIGPIWRLPTEKAPKGEIWGYPTMQDVELNGGDFQRIRK